MYIIHYQKGSRHKTVGCFFTKEKAKAAFREILVDRGFWKTKVCVGSDKEDLFGSKDENGNTLNQAIECLYCHTLCDGEVEDIYGERVLQAIDNIVEDFVF